MKKTFLIIGLMYLALSSSAQLNIQSTSGVLIPVFSSRGYLDIKQMDSAFLFSYFDYITGVPKNFTLNNRQSAKDFLNLVLTMFEKQDKNQSFMFRNGKVTYTVSWTGDLLLLFIVDDYGRADAFKLKKDIIETVKI